MIKVGYFREELGGRVIPIYLEGMIDNKLVLLAYTDETVYEFQSNIAKESDFYAVCPDEVSLDLKDDGQFYLAMDNQEEAKFTYNSLDFEDVESGTADTSDLLGNFNKYKALAGVV